MKKIWFIPAFVFAAVVGLAAQPSAITPAGLDGDKCGPPPPVKLEASGNPTWKPVDFHVFTASSGSPPDYVEFGQTMTYLFYPLRHQTCVNLGIGPGDRHQPPYNHEVEAGIDIMNYREVHVSREGVLRSERNMGCVRGGAVSENKGVLAGFYVGPDHPEHPVPHPHCGRSLPQWPALGPVPCGFRNATSSQPGGLSILCRSQCGWIQPLPDLHCRQFKFWSS